MKITDVASMEFNLNTHHVDARKIFESSHAVTIIVTIKPGVSLKKHITPVAVFFYVLEGSGIIEIGSERQTVGKDMLVESPARIPHACESASILFVLVVKVLKTAEDTTLL